MLTRQQIEQEGWASNGRRLAKKFTGEDGVEREYSLISNVDGTLNIYFNGGKAFKFPIFQGFCDVIEDFRLLIKNYLKI